MEENKKIRGLLLLADGVEETEAVSTHDILTRAGITCDMVSTKDCHRIHTSMGLTLRVEANLKELGEGYKDYDFIVLPGGKVGVTNLEKNKKVQKIIEYFHQENKLICAICAAPSILGNKGYLDDRNYTCFPGFERGHGNKDSEHGAVEDKNLITGRSMYWTIMFAETIVKHYLGQEGLDKIYHGTRGADLPR